MLPFSMSIGLRPSTQLKLTILFCYAYIVIRTSRLQNCSFPKASVLGGHLILFSALT